MNYTVAKQYFENYNYRDAFSCFKQIAEDDKNALVVRANALNMMGVIVSGFSPDLDIEDVSGFKYFQKAIELDSNNIGALLNIIESHEDLPSDNKQQLTYIMACKRLATELSDRITPHQLSKVRDKCDKFGL